MMRPAPDAKNTAGAGPDFRPYRPKTDICVNDAALPVISEDMRGRFIVLSVDRDSSRLVRKHHRMIGSYC